MDEIVIKLKMAKNNSIVFAEGPNGEILYIEAFPGLPPEDMRKYREQRDAILNDNHHLKNPDKYVTLSEVPSSRGVMEIGLKPLTGEDLARNDLRKGIQVVSEQAMKDLKG